MRREDTIAIVNPRSGGSGAGIDRLGRMAASVVLTERPRHACELAAAASGFQTIIAAGGDGTVFEILQGMNRDKQRLCLLPVGRGNSLARDLKREPQRIDLMEVSLDGYQFVCASTIAAGYPAAVAAAADRRFRAMGGYCYAAAGALTRPSRFGARISFEGDAACDVRITGLIINNTRHLANFLAFPQASLSDGRLDTLELRNGFFGQNLHNLSALLGRDYRGAHRKSARSMDVEWEDGRTVLLDGELLPQVHSLKIRVLESALCCGLAA